ncbi:hypothetical protein BC938DRAFT_481816 [Jimgerdemannia flammicorona]|uniref:ZZ-type domain-containing protein n=1 Tax=Jimgerdemannia flammicorona TaxID=994334 RepID=A0A433QFA5_9FUNG|nr:hypothetical protein BC938DRAFT_481816 [Jimgerdemannia flammicorona]
MRWKCNDCRDYDLCQVCKSNNKHNHTPSHSFLAIPYPRNHVLGSTRTHGPAHTQAQRTQGAVYHQAQCDFCESIIKGMRHKCINCPDFDLCDSCIALAATQHPDHTFMQIAKPGHPEIKMQSMY